MSWKPSTESGNHKHQKKSETTFNSQTKTSQEIVNRAANDISRNSYTNDYNKVNETK